MATASFFRFPRADNDIGQDGADFRPGEEAFQMVPLEQTRPGFVSVSGGPVRIASADPNIVQISSGATLPTVPVLTFNQTSAGGFTLNATNNPGRTFIVAEDEKGKRLAHLAVSVKAQQTVRYHVLRLRDALNNTAMSITETEPILKNVEILYLNQTNVRLLKGKTGEIQIKRVLSDANGVLQLQEVFDNKEDIIFDEVKARNFFDAEVVVVFTWPIEGADPPRTTGKKLLGRTTPGRFRTGPRMIYINSIGKGGPSHAFTVAHEFGHHFGLEHSGPRPQTFLMDKSGTSGFKMTQDDINTVNPSGT